MKLFLLVSFVFVCLGSAILGLRMLTVGLRSRTAPELAYGSALLMMAIGSVVRLVVFGVLGGGPEYHPQIIASGVARLITLVALTSGIHVIFRPGVGWSKALVAAFWGLGLCSFGVVIAYPGGIPEAGALYSVGDLAAGLVAIWGACESFSYWGKLRKRQALGLCDPVTAARFRMWGTSFSFAAIAGLLVATGTLVLNAPITTAPTMLALVQLCLVVTTGLTWLAFYPPQRLQAWLRAHHSAVSPG